MEDIIGIKPMTSDQPIIQTPPRSENKDPREYEPILEKLMREREKQALEFLKKVPIPDHRGQYPYSQGINQERNLDDQATSPKVLIKSPMREERGTTPRERGDHGKPIGASPHTQVKTRYEVEMDGRRRRIGSTEKQGQSTHRRTYPSQPPPPLHPTGGGAGGHRGGGGGGGGGDDEGPDDSDDGSDDDDEDESEETDSETSSTQEIPQEELPEELRGQRVFRRRINGRGHGYSQRSYRNPR